MSRRRVIGGLAGSATAALIGALALAVALPAGGSVALAPPAPCSAAVVMTDAIGDGHHIETDVLSAWLSEANGTLQAVIEARLGTWKPFHTDADVVVVGYAFLFENEGQTRYVRMSVDADDNAVFDYGTWALPNTFTQLGLTTGDRDTNNVGPAAAWIDVPAALADAGDLLTGTFVLTYDGIIGGVPTDVDQAPGGEHPDDTTRGPDYLVGPACSSVSISVPPSIKGAKTVTISGHVEPAADDTPVAITRQGLNTLVTNTTTDASGNYSVNVPVKETTRVHATANEIDSTTRRITVRSTVTIKAIRLRNGKTRIKGVTGPWLPGRVQLIKTTAFTPAASKQIAGGKFSFSPRRLSPGRWQVIYTPSGGRAVRSISPAVRVR